MHIYYFSYIIYILFIWVLSLMFWLSTKQTLAKQSLTIQRTYATKTVSSLPEVFPQTIILSNGATYTIRTTSPRTQVQLTKDTRNHPLWNPTIARIGARDEGGQIAKFTKRFGMDDDLKNLTLIGTDEKASGALKKALEVGDKSKAKSKKKK